MSIGQRSAGDDVCHVYDFRVSVVIPVYNAELYIEQCVRSALDQPQVDEVICVDDGSTDSTLAIIKRLSRESSRVIVKRHADGVNLGKSASRNLGLAVARCPFICFLDADDYFLPNRFRITERVFMEHRCVDVVHEGIQTRCETDQARLDWRRLNGRAVTQLNPSVGGTISYLALVDGRFGRFAMGGVTIRRGLINRVGGFNPEFTVSQDVEWFARLALLGRFHGGADLPCVVRRRHASNSYCHDNPAYVGVDARVALSVLRWSRYRIRDEQRRSVIVREAWMQALYLVNKRSVGSILAGGIVIWSAFITYPKLLTSRMLLIHCIRMVAKSVGGQLDIPGPIALAARRSCIWG